MKPPKRLCDDPAAPGELRVDLARAQRAARDYEHLAKLGALRAALAQGAASPSDVPSATGSGDKPVLGTARAGWSQLKAIWGWRLVLLGAVGGAGVVGLSLATRPLWSAPVVAVKTTVRPAASVSSHARVPEPGSNAAAAAPADKEARVAATARAAAPAGVRASRREVDQVVRMRSLLRQDPAGAYRLAKQSEREFPDGALREEREALSLLALAKLGRLEEARGKARAFLARHPESTMRNAVQALLEE